MAAAGGASPVTYVLVVDDPPVPTGGTVGAHVLLDAPVTAPPAQDTATASARGEAEEKKEELFPQKWDQQTMMMKVGGWATHGERPDSCFTAVQS